jgi:L-rhamnono-1,4-lactonase
MPPQAILDSHIHLWPNSAANPESHPWMTKDGYLTEQKSIDDYVNQTSPASGSDSTPYDIRGFIYVETDRTVLKSGSNEDVQNWAAGPLQEIAFLRRVVEGRPEKTKEQTQTSSTKHVELDEGFDASHSKLLKGIVAWAPLDRGIEGFQQYLQAAKEVAGEETWKRIRGCRYLLQGIKDLGQFKKLVGGQDLIDLLRLLGEENWSFDVGIDARSGGIWQLAEFAETLNRVHEGVETKDKTVFILSQPSPQVFLVSEW